MATRSKNIERLNEGNYETMWTIHMRNALIFNDLYIMSTERGKTVNKRRSVDKKLLESIGSDELEYHICTTL